VARLNQPPALRLNNRDNGCIRIVLLRLLLLRQVVGSTFERGIGERDGN